MTVATQNGNGKPAEAEEAKVARTLGEAIPELRRPFAPAAVKWKLQTNPKNDDNPSALAVAFHDARLVADRLNAVCPGDWSTEFVRDDVFGMVRCKLTVFGVTREDVGFAKAGKDATDMQVKGLYSDALKRAAVHFGVGASLYALPALWVKGDSLKKGNNGKWFLTAAGFKDLRGRYDGFLDAIGVASFGQPLDHGDPDEPQAEADPTESEVYRFGPEGHDHARRALAVLLGRKADEALEADREKEARTWWQGLQDDQARWLALIQEGYTIAVGKRLNELRGERSSKWTDARGIEPYSEVWGAIWEIEKREPLLAQLRVPSDGVYGQWFPADPVDLRRSAEREAERRFTEELTQKGTEAFA
jgi:hypothetical protein